MLLEWPTPMHAPLRVSANGPTPGRRREVGQALRRVLAAHPFRSANPTPRTALGMLEVHRSSRARDQGIGLYDRGEHGHAHPIWPSPRPSVFFSFDYNDVIETISSASYALLFQVATAHSHISVLYRPALHPKPQRLLLLGVPGATTQKPPVKTSFAHSSHL